MNPIDELANLFLKFPGIGRRQARRFAYFIVQSGSSFAQKLSRQIIETQQQMKLDPTSFQYYYGSPLASDPTRDATTLMIVAKDVDIESLEKSKAYHGHYFVLGGLAPMIDTELDTTIRIRELLKNIESRGTQLKEIIFALAANPEGDRTTELLRQKIIPLQEKFKFTLSQLGRGFSTGTEVEYSDPDTLASALKNRK